MINGAPITAVMELIGKSIGGIIIRATISAPPVIKAPKIAETGIIIL